MKRLLISFIIFLPLVFCAQINVGDNGYGSNFSSPGKLDDDDVLKLKNTITVFILPEHKKGELETFREVIASSWYFNTIEVITSKDVEKYKAEIGKYSFIQIGFFIKDLSGLSVTYYLEYIYPHLNKKGKKRDITLATVNLYPVGKTEPDLTLLKLGDYEPTVFKGVNETTEFQNFTPAHLKMYLSFVSSSINNRETHWVIQENELTEDKNLLGKLANDTLFVPEYATRISPADVNSKTKMYELITEYKYKVQFLSPKAFEEKILKSQKVVFALTGVFTYSTVYLTVFEARSGSLIYSTFRSDNKPNEKDFGKLYKKIEKSLK